MADAEYTADGTVAVAFGIGLFQGFGVHVGGFPFWAKHPRGATVFAFVLGAARSVVAVADDVGTPAFAAGVGCLYHFFYFGQI